MNTTDALDTASNLIAAAPDGLALCELADAVGVPAETLREALWREARWRGLKVREDVWQKRTQQSHLAPDLAQ